MEPAAGGNAARGRGRPSWPKKALAILAACLAFVPSGARASVGDAVTGSGHITRGGENRTFEFSVTKTADGRAQGMANSACQKRRLAPQH